MWLSTFSCHLKQVLASLQYHQVLMKMVRFGADQILTGKGGNYIMDEDIDALIARGEERTSKFQAKLQTNAQHNLANFSLIDDDETGRDQESD
jgi:SWI/SNF-related matrix-associated actin-dependent regulator of chromatin subfamily A member 5